MKPLRVVIHSSCCVSTVENKRKIYTYFVYLKNFRVFLEVRFSKKRTFHSIYFVKEN